MIGRDCRCPGCGTCGAAQEVEVLRERLAVERTPNGAGKWNAERVLREKAERERDELKTRLAHAEADAEQAIHNEAFNERQRIVDWIRVRSTRDSKGPEASFRELAVMWGMINIAKEIERGEHER